MKAYDPEKPLISLHIPKCAGQSFRQVLNQWFGGHLFIHYFQQYNALPPKHALKPGMCIHGHFNRTKKMGTADYYPTVDQFITILRDPLEIAISNYFFWKKKERSRQLKLGIIKEGDEHDYRNIDDFFKKRPRSHILNFMPCDLTVKNYKQILETKFIWIGLSENLQASVDILSKLLGFERASINHVNASKRDEELSSINRKAFIDNNQSEFEIYQYVQERQEKQVES